MTVNRRIAALCALLAVTWTALWPLVSTAHAFAFGDSMPLCHQAGMQVGADEAAPADASGPAQPSRQHCPLCIMAFFAMTSPPVLVTGATPAPADIANDLRAAVLPADLTVRLPESRAPPVFASI
jgi:hypothetical protein